MKCKMHVIRDVLNFDLDNSTASILRFRKRVYVFGKHTDCSIDDKMSFNIINIHCIILSVTMDNGYNSELLFIFNLTEPTGYMVVNNQQMFSIKLLQKKEYNTLNLVLGMNIVDQLTLMAKY